MQNAQFMKFLTSKTCNCQHFAESHLGCALEWTWMMWPQTGVFFQPPKGNFGLAQLIGEWMWFFLSKVVPLLEALGAVKHKHIKYHVYDSIVQWASWELVMAPCCWDYLYTIRVTRSDFNNSFTMFFLVERSYFLLTLGVLQRMTFSSLVSLVRRQGSCPHEEMVLYIFWNDAK